MIIMISVDASIQSQQIEAGPKSPYFWSWLQTQWAYCQSSAKAGFSEVSFLILKYFIATYLRFYLSKWTSYSWPVIIFFSFIQSYTKLLCYNHTAVLLLAIIKIAEIMLSIAWFLMMNICRLLSWRCFIFWQGTVTSFPLSTLKEP